MLKQVIVAITLDKYRYLEEQARAAGTTIARHAGELLEDLLEPPPAPKLKTPSLAAKVAAQQAAQRPKPAKPPAKPAAKPIKPAVKPPAKPGVLRGLAIHSPERRSEIAKKAAATRKQRAEEAARLARRSKRN